MTQTTLPARKWTPYEQTQLSRHGLGQLRATESTDQPVEYLTGKVDFLGWQFQVSPAVLIPRVETEELVKLALAEIQLKLSTQPTMRVLDLATGSGAIGLSLWRLLAERNQSLLPEIWLSDISPAALAVAKQNWHNLQIKYSVAAKAKVPRFLESDLLNNWPTDQSISFLIANLPYIPTNRLKSLDSSVQNHEPRLALDGGSDGLQLIDRLLEQAQEYLVKNGTIWLEVDESHTPQQLKDLRPEYSYHFFSDSFGKSRFVRATFLA